MNKLQQPPTYEAQALPLHVFRQHRIEVQELQLEGVPPLHLAGTQPVVFRVVTEDRGGGSTLGEVDAGRGWGG